MEKPYSKNQQSAGEHLPTYQVRPRFQVETSFAAGEIEELLKLALQKENAPVKGRIYSGYGSFWLPPNEQHYWSPVLTLTTEESEESNENGILLRGMYGPRPTVWTMFIFFYAFIGFALMVISMVGLSNYWLGKSAVILWLVPLLLLIFLSLYLVAYFGQKLGHDQMVVLHAFLEEALGISVK